MPELNSPLVGGISQSYAPGMGNGVDVPNILLPVVQAGLPLNVALQIYTDLRKANRSALITRVINQGAGTGPTSVQMTSLDKGLWRIQGEVTSLNLVGPAASSAAPAASRMSLFVTPNVATHLCTTFLLVGVPQRAQFGPLVLNLVGDTDIWLETQVASGAGESMGVYGSVYCERLL